MSERLASIPSFNSPTGPASAGIASRCLSGATEPLKLAAAHVESGGEGIFGYNLFSISRRDLAKAKEIHLRYYRELQELIARSKPNEHVALFAAQLFRLDRG